MAGGFGRGPRKMDSPAYSIRIKAETDGKAINEQAQRQRKILIISLVCCAAVLLLGALASGLWYYGRLGVMAGSEKPPTSLNASSIGSSQCSSAETKRTIYGSDQAPVLGEVGSQTRVSERTSGDNAGTAQVGDGSMVSKFRLFYANNKRAVLIAIIVSVFAAVAVAAAVTTSILLRQQQPAVSTDSGGPGAIIHHPDAAPTTDIPLIIGLAILFLILASISIYWMVREKHLRPQNTAQVFFHFIFFTIFISPFALVRIIADFVEYMKCGFPIFTKAFKVFLGVIAFPFAVFGLITSVIWRFLPKIVSESFKKEVLSLIELDEIASDFAKRVKDLCTSAGHA